MERAIVVSYKTGQSIDWKFGFAALIDSDNNHLPGRDLHLHFNDSRTPQPTRGGLVLDWPRPGREPKIGDIIVFDRSGMRDKGKTGRWAYESDWLAAGGTL